MTSQYDLVVMGAGSGGMAAAKRAASRGKSVAVIENRTVGGTCVARGCMPKKFLVLASEKIRMAHSRGPSGLTIGVEGLDWTDLIDHEQGIVTDLIDRNRDGLVGREGIELIQGTARLSGRRTVRVGDRELEYETLVLAMGLRPADPPVDGIEHAQTSDQFLQDHTLPGSIGIVGGGYIGVEFASILTSFGVNVKIFQRPGQIIKQHDVRVAQHLQNQLEERGVEIYTESEVQRIEKTGRAYRVSVEQSSGSRTFTVERVLNAAGRQPNTEELGLVEQGIRLDDEGYVPVGEDMRSSREEVFAVGDVNGVMQFTPVAILEGKTAAENAVTGDSSPVDYRHIPRAVFTSPPVGSVGLNESDARQEHDRVQVATRTFTPFRSAVYREPDEVFIKLIYTGENRRLAGLHVVGPHAPEMVQGFALAMQQGATQGDLADFPGIHPTVAEEVFSTKPG